MELIETFLLKEIICVWNPLLVLHDTWGRIQRFRSASVIQFAIGLRLKSFLMELRFWIFFQLFWSFREVSACFFGHTRVLVKSGIYFKSRVFFIAWRFIPKNLSSEALRVSQEFSTPVVETLVCNNPRPRTQKNQI